MDTASIVFHFMIHLVSKSSLCPFEFPLTDYQIKAFCPDILLFTTKRSRCNWIYRATCRGVNRICSWIQNCHGMSLKQLLVTYLYTHAPRHLNTNVHAWYLEFSIIIAASSGFFYSFYNPNIMSNCFYLKIADVEIPAQMFWFC